MIEPIVIATYLKDCNLAEEVGLFNLDVFGLLLAEDLHRKKMDSYSITKGLIEEGGSKEKLRDISLKNVDPGITIENIEKALVKRYESKGYRLEPGHLNSILVFQKDGKTTRVCTSRLYKEISNNRYIITQKLDSLSKQNADFSLLS